jgi:xylan 1,4-beta-xylosidase
MSYWTFTDIFEENGPVPSPFHGGFGLISFQGLRKPSFYAYQFLNRLGEEELVCNDRDSWVTRGGGGAQVLFWNYTPPKTEESDQVYFKRDLPSVPVGNVRISISGLRPGSYKLNVYRVGYGLNDVYTDYFTMGSPKTLTREQVKSLGERNDGRAIETQAVRVAKSGVFSKDIPMLANDVYLITFARN